MFEITPNEIIIPLLAVGLAEMGDKTQLSILLLSSRTQEYVRLFWHYAGLSAGGWICHQDDEVEISEWGDKTQIASALFATKYNLHDDRPISQVTPGESGPA